MQMKTVVLPLTGPAVKVPVKRHFLYTEKLVVTFQFSTQQNDFDGEVTYLRCRVHHLMSGTNHQIIHP